MARRRRLLKRTPPLVRSGPCLLAVDLVSSPLGLGFNITPTEIADLPVDAMYFAIASDSGLPLYVLPIVRHKMAVHQMSSSPDPVWSKDPSYGWRRSEEFDDAETPPRL